jgi:molecular chaperone DnaK
MGTAIYQAAQAAQAAEGSATGSDSAADSESAADDNVVDAEIVDEGEGGAAR